MAESKKFQLWLKMQLGEDLVAESEAFRRVPQRVDIPESDLKWEYGADARR